MLGTQRHLVSYSENKSDDNVVGEIRNVILPPLGPLRVMSEENDVVHGVKDDQSVKDGDRRGRDDSQEEEDDKSI